MHTFVHYYHEFAYYFISVMHKFNREQQFFCAFSFIFVYRHSQCLLYLWICAVCVAVYFFSFLHWPRQIISILRCSFLRRHFSLRKTYFNVEYIFCILYTYRLYSSPFRFIFMFRQQRQRNFILLINCNSTNNEYGANNALFINNSTNLNFISVCF